MIRCVACNHGDFVKLRPELRAPTLDPERRDHLVELCESIVDRVVSGEPAAGSIYEFNRAVERVFGPTTFRGVFGSEEPADFVDRILTRVPDELPDISDAEAEEMVRRIQSDDVDDRESWYWVRLLAEHFEQPRFSDLVYWPSRELEPAEIVSAARRADDALDAYLDASAHGPVDRREPQGSPRARRAARRLLQELSRFELLEVVDDEKAIDLVAPIMTTTVNARDKAAAIANVLLEPFVTSELLASEQQIAAILPKIETLSD